MELLKAIATYLISRRVTSSQSMSKWFTSLRVKFPEIARDSFTNGEFHEFVRFLHDAKAIDSEIATYLLQITLWIDEATEKVRALEEQGFKVLLEGDFGFPQAFAEIADKPTILFCYGDLTILSSPRLVTLVGTRTPSLWGQTKARQLAQEAAACQVTTVSGLAQGIDRIVFDAAQEFSSKTIAILPQLFQLTEITPAINTLYISEYPPTDQEISKWQFVARNRLLAALSPITIIIEAPIRSGTLITADLAISYGETVYTVLPDPNEDSGYGGLTFALSQLNGSFINSLYDMLYQENWESELELYKQFVYSLSKQTINMKSTDHRHLAQADLKRYLHAYSKGDLSILESTVIELQRFGIIKERKNKIVFNFSGSNLWPKI